MFIAYAQAHLYGFILVLALQSQVREWRWLRKCIENVVVVNHIMNRSMDMGMDLGIEGDSFPKQKRSKS